MTISELPPTAQQTAPDAAALVLRLAAAPVPDLFCYWNRPLLDDPVLATLRSVGGRFPSRRIVFPVSRDAAALAAHASWQQGGTEVRHSSHLPPGALLLGADSALVTTRDHRGVGWSHTEDPGVLSALRLLAQTLWRRAETPAEAEAMPNAYEEAILSMLLAGFTDGTIARRLGRSDRTVRRTVAQLMERLGAQSRFEAGVRAVERRWI